MRRFARSLRHALAGLRLVMAERNARLHAVATLAVIAAGLWFRLGRTDWLWLLAAIGFVWATEAMNTALETLADTVHPGEADGIRRAKDLAAGAVLAAALTAAAIGVTVFWPFLFG